MRCGHLSALKRTNNGYGWPLMPTPEKLLGYLLAIALGNRQRSFGNFCLRFTASAPCVTRIFGKPTSKYCPVNGTALLVRKQVKPVILSGSIIPCGSELGD